MADVGTQVVQVPLRGGVNTGVDKRAIEAPDLTWAQNVVLDTDGVLKKRRGYAAISSDNVRTVTTFNRCDGLAVYNDELVAFSGAGDLWARAEGNGDLANGGNCQAPSARIVSRRPIRRVGTTPGIPRADVAYEPTSGIMVGLYNATGDTNSQATILDTRTGVVRWFDTPAVGGLQRFRLVTVGQYIFALLPAAASANIRMNRLDCNNPTNLTTNPNGTPQITDYDPAVGALSACPYSATEFFTAHARTADFVVARRNTLGVAGGSVSIAETLAGPVQVRYIGSLLWVAWQRSGGDIRAAAYNAAMANVVAPFTVSAASAQTFTLQWAYRSATNVMLGWDNGTDCRFREITTGGAFSGPEKFFLAHHLESGFFDIDGRSFIVVGTPSSLQGGSYLIDAGPATLLATVSHATLAPLLSGALPTSTPGETVSSVVQTTDGTFIFAHTVKAKVTLEGGGLFPYATANLGVDFVELDLSSGKRYRTTQHGGELFIAGATPCVFDDGYVTEAGLLRFPEAPVFLNQFTLGGAMEPGTYQYVVTYRYEDYKGRVWRSSPSLPLTVVVPAGTSTNRVSMSVTYLPYTRAYGDVRLELWRTAKNESGPFYLTASAINQPKVASGAFLDALADATITVAETVYTSGGALANFPPPPCTFAISHGDVLIVDNAEDGTLWQSKPLVAGEGFGFNGALSYRLSSSERPVMGVSMDDKCVVFTAHEIHMLVGAPLDDKGSGGGFQAQRINSPVGCIDPRSVVLGKEGIYFQSDRGIELLTRGLEVIWVGADVAYWVANYGECLFAQAVPSLSEIRFAFGSPAGGVAEDHQILRLNYERRSQAHAYGSWTTELVGMGVPRAGAVASGVMNLGYSDGRLFRESASVFTDNGAHVPMAVRMMLKPAGMQGFVRLRRLSLLAERKSSHKLTLYVRYNYDDAIASQRTWTNSELASLPREQVSVCIALQKAEAYEVEIQDAADTAGPGPDTGEGCWLSGLALELAVKQRTFARAMAQESKK